MGGSLLIWYWILRTDYTVRARLKTVITHSYTFCNWGHFNWIELNWIFFLLHRGPPRNHFRNPGDPKSPLRKSQCSCVYRARDKQRAREQEREWGSEWGRERELQPKTNVLFLQRAKCNNKSSGSSLQLSERSSYSPIWASTVSECVCVCVCFCRVYLTRWIAICICLYNQFGCFNDPIIWWAKGIIKKNHILIFYSYLILFILLSLSHFILDLFLSLSLSFLKKEHSYLTLITIFFFFFTQSVFYFFCLSFLYSRLYPSAFSIFIVTLILILSWESVKGPSNIF